jgi:iron complex transport system substrate-binding protein
VIAEMRKEIERVRDKAKLLPRPRVFCEEWGKPIISSQPWVAELVEAAGGEFLGTPAAQIPPDEISRLDPEVIIAAWCGAGDRVPLEKIVSGRGWQQTSAARHARVYCIRDEFLNTPAPTLLNGLHALAHAIHPETFLSTKGIRRITDVSSSAAANLAR